MAFSEMSSKERTIIAILGVVILVALIGIGVLIARLVASGKVGERAPSITVAATVPPEGATAEATITLVANPSLEGLVPTTPRPTSDQPVPVVRAESPSPLLPAMLTNHLLHPGRRYRLEITAVDGSKVQISGSWSQAAKSASGETQTPLPEFFDGTTPFRLDLVPPMDNPSSWSCSVSVGPKDLLGQPPKLVITIWDVTGSK